MNFRNTKYFLLVVVIASILGSQLVLRSQPPLAPRTTQAADEQVLMELKLTIDRPASSRGGYRKPYVAIWIEDQDGYPIRTISLWVQKSGPGPRWIPDLRQWYKSDRLRQLVESTDLVDGISGATRNAGSYKVAWDGLDGSGAACKPGKYTLFVESAREHGTYQLIKFPFEHGDKAFSENLPGNTEIKDLQLNYLGTSNIKK
ncbi:MAG: DUF2271 domain-containing protein [Planctomycetales bacterium]|nr:DUF2271 domain-containing protein [Planctomycetales bacterium]